MGQGDYNTITSPTVTINSKKGRTAVLSLTEIDIALDLGEGALSLLVQGSGGNITLS